ncbi:hypothetical protein J6590_068683 [Homalodisca vitripennis]|nr:hypothetical protein J6590_068683 [Homalodisca vitripennis]
MRTFIQACRAHKSQHLATSGTSYRNPSMLNSTQRIREVSRPTNNKPKPTSKPNQVDRLSTQEKSHLSTILKIKHEEIRASSLDLTFATPSLHALLEEWEVGNDTLGSNNIFRNINIRRQITIDDQQVPVVSYIKLLDVVVDSELDFKSHINNISLKCQRDIGIIKTIVCGSKGSTPELALKIYKVFMVKKTGLWFLFKRTCQ